MKIKRTVSFILSLITVISFVLIIASAEGRSDKDNLSECCYLLEEYFSIRNSGTKKELDLKAFKEMNLFDYDSKSSKISEEIYQTEIARSRGFNDLVKTCGFQLIDVNTNFGNIENYSEKDNKITLSVQELVTYRWFDSAYSSKIETSVFSTEHSMVFENNSDGIVLIKDLYDEYDITGIDTSEKVCVTEKVPEPSAPSSKSLSYASFSVSAMKTYANKYTSSSNDYTYYNKQYKNYNNSGGDCCNYVSQCLKAGGMKSFSTWTYDNNDTPCNNSSHSATTSHTCTSDDTLGKAWRSCTYFISAIRENYSCSYVKKTSPSSTDYLKVSDFYPGDFVFSVDSSGATYHVMLCMGKATDNSYIIYNGHNNDRKGAHMSQSYFKNNGTARLHLHNYSDYASSSSLHWKVCVCGAEHPNRVSHTWENHTTYYECKICGRRATDIPTTTSLKKILTK